MVSDMGCRLSYGFSAGITGRPSRQQGHRLPDTPPVLLVTRATAQAERFLSECEARLGGQINAVIDPVFEIRWLLPKVHFGAYQGFIFTSENAVLAVRDRLEPGGKPAYCVGDRTAATASKAGFAAVSAGGDAEDLVTLLARASPIGRLLHLRGRHVTGSILKRLRDAGVNAAEAIVYDQTARALSEDGQRLIEAPDGKVVLPLFSPRSATLVRESVDVVSDKVIPIAMSLQVANAWRNGPVRPLLAHDPSSNAMVEAVLAKL